MSSLNLSQSGVSEHCSVVLPGARGRELYITGRRREEYLLLFTDSVTVRRTRQRRPSVEAVPVLR